MKKILFIIGSLDTGGVSKSMLSLLNTIDCKKYEVSLLLMSDRGAFSDAIPRGVHVITDKRISSLLHGVLGVKELLMQGHLLLALGLFLKLVITPFSRSYAGMLLAKLTPAASHEVYDLIVDYNGQHQLYYMVDKLQGEKKVTFFHSDYKKWPYYEKADRRYFPFVDGIYTISDICVQSLKDVFPEVADKVRLMENIISPTMLNSLAKEPIAECSGHKHLLITLGHVCVNKGCDTAIEVAKELKNRGLDFEWWFVGLMASDYPYVDKVKEYGLQDNIKYLGIKTNPYPYVAASDMVVHLSLFEGKSIALDEAKLLCKPVVVTNFSSVNDQFTDHVNASICEIGNVADIVNKIMELAQNRKLRELYVGYLSTHMRDNSNEVEKLYKLM